MTIRHCTPSAVNPLLNYQLWFECLNGLYQFCRREKSVGMCFDLREHRPLTTLWETQGSISLRMWSVWARSGRERTESTLQWQLASRSPGKVLRSAIPTRRTPSLSQSIYTQALPNPQLTADHSFYSKSYYFWGPKKKKPFFYQHGGNINTEEKSWKMLVLVRLAWCKCEGGSQPTSPDWGSLQLQKHLFQFLKKKSETGC